MNLLEIDLAEITALLTVVGIDVALAGDNAVVVGMAASGLPPHLRRKAMLLGIGAAALLRGGFAFIAVQLLQIVGLTAAGGLLLLWVAWKLWRELRSQHDEDALALAGRTKGKTLRDAVTQILIADLSMSLDNVLAVAGAAREHAVVLVFGLGLSVILMVAAAELVARMIKRYRWIAYIGLALVVYVALSMMWDGGYEIWHHLNRN